MFIVNKFYNLVKYFHFLFQEADGKLVHKGEEGWVYGRLAP